MKNLEGSLRQFEEAIDQTLDNHHQRAGRLQNIGLVLRDRLSEETSCEKSEKAP